MTFARAFACKRARAGQAMTETLVVVWFFTLALLAVLWAARRISTRLVLDHAAARTARARAVGYNDFMLLKTARVASIPVSGRCLTLFGDGNRPSYAEELSRVPRYLASEDASIAAGCLDYEGWERLEHPETSAGNRITARLTLHPDKKDRDLLTGFIAGRETGEYSVENHASLYMNEEGL